MKGVSNIIKGVLAPLLLLALLIYVVYRSFKGDHNPVLYPYDSYNLSINKVEASHIAEQLHSAMRNLGTDEYLIFSVLEGLNKDDLILVFNEFGYRKLGLFGSDLTKLDLEGSSLNQWFKSELSYEDYEKVKEIFLETDIPF